MAVVKQLSAAAVERAMKLQDRTLRAMAKRITWYQAAEILDISCRQIRRCKKRFEHEGLFDRRRGIPSPKRSNWKQSRRYCGCIRRNISILTCGIFTRSWARTESELRVLGILMFDSEHSLGHHLKRHDNWEVHPVLAMDYSPRRKKCSAGSDDNWVKLGDQQ
jgi:hypothetical protein